MEADLTSIDEQRDGAGGELAQAGVALDDSAVQPQDLVAEPLAHRTQARGRPPLSVREARRALPVPTVQHRIGEVLPSRPGMSEHQAALVVLSSQAEREGVWLHHGGPRSPSTRQTKQLS